MTLFKHKDSCSYRVVAYFEKTNLQSSKNVDKQRFHCPRGGIGRHKGLKILALRGVPVRVRPRAPLNY